MKAKIKRELKEKKRKERNLHLGRFPLPWPSYPFWPAHLSLIPPAQPTQAPGLVIHSRSAQGGKESRRACISIRWDRFVCDTTAAIVGPTSQLRLHPYHREQIFPFSRVCCDSPCPPEIHGVARPLAILEYMYARSQPFWSSDGRNRENSSSFLPQFRGLLVPSSSLRAYWGGLHWITATAENSRRRHNPIRITAWCR